MSTINLKWSAQAAQLYASVQPRLEAAFDKALAGVLPDERDVAGATYDFGATALRVTLGNGAVLAVDGIAMGSSVITADRVRLYRDDTATIELPGHYAIRYMLVNGAPQILDVDGRIDSFGIVSHWQPGSASYDEEIGNVGLYATGSLVLGSDYSVQGRFDGIHVSTTAGTVQGSFYGDFGVGASGLAPATLTGLSLSYMDNSYLGIDGAAIDASSLTLANTMSLLGIGANFAGDDVFNLDAQTNEFLPMIDTGDGNDRITLTGGAHYDVATGAGDDVITLLAGKSSIQAGAGFDTAIIAGRQADFVASRSGTWNVFVRPDGSYSAGLQGVERVLFDDGAVALDIDGHAGQAYRLYTAALGRAPDAAGLGYWIGVLDRGAALHAVASEFVASAEFTALVGANADNATFVTKLYNNILHRAPDAAGLQYWQGVLEGGAGRAGVVVEFSEGTENQAQVIGAIHDGIDYLPYR